MKKQLAYFINIEGVEGVGKSTAREYISEYLNNAGVDFVLTREPGGTQIAEAIRDVLLSHHTEVMSDDCELLLMFAARAQHIARVIRPALAAGKWVVCDRFTDTSYAYQGAGRGLGQQRVAGLEQWVHADLQPDVTILLDAPVELGLERIKQRSAKDRIEEEGLGFFQRIRDCYLQRAKTFSERYRIIDASQSLENVQAQLAQLLQGMLA